MEMIIQDNFRKSKITGIFEGDFTIDNDHCQSALFFFKKSFEDLDPEIVGFLKIEETFEETFEISGKTEDREQLKKARKEIYRLFDLAQIRILESKIANIKRRMDRKTSHLQ